MNVIEVKVPSEAADEIASALSDSTTYVIRFAVDGGLKIKVNEGMWTPPLKTDGFP